MRPSWLLSAAALTLALGCGDPSSPTAVVDPIAPASSVERSTGPFFAFGFGNDQYSVILGASYENWVTFCTTGEQNWDSFDALVVTRPDGSQKLTFKGPSQHLLVWNNPADVCAEPPDFAGTVHWVSHDSDFDLSGHGTDASGQTVHGIVTDAAGQEYRFLAVSLLTVAPQYTLDDAVLVFHVNKIKITPLR